MLYVIVNPTAGNGKAAKTGKKIEAELIKRNIEHEIHYTEFKGNATDLARDAVKRGFKTVVSVGGDGTSYETVCGLKDSDVALAIIPAGTGNDFIRALGIPKNYKKALDVALTKPARSVDCGTVNGRMFLNACGTGFDITVLDYAQKARKYVKGPLTYLYGVVKTVFNFSPTCVKVTVNGETVFDGDILVIAISNGPYYGGGIKIAPNAAPDDGLFDITIVRPIGSSAKMVTYLPGLAGGKVLTFKETTALKAKKVTVESKGMRFNIDGEIIQTDVAELELVTDRLKMHY
ncbi:MAG: diacylglycerol kinase family lipid kinase [Clostridia bacterium]|nr:diacylglycerol kinase family lipid kinase [Clostridia bacterium]